jgi:hypothetical protein
VPSRRVIKQRGRIGARVVVPSAGQCDSVSCLEKPERIVLATFNHTHIDVAVILGSTNRVLDHVESTVRNEHKIDGAGSRSRLGVARLQFDGV